MRKFKQTINSLKEKSNNIKFSILENEVFNLCLNDLYVKKVKENLFNYIQKIEDNNLCASIEHLVFRNGNLSLVTYGLKKIEKKISSSLLSVTITIQMCQLFLPDIICAILLKNKKFMIFYVLRSDLYCQSTQMIRCF